MNGYAPNPASSSEPGYAPLTAGLLARKGEALPAVDADAHAGIDIDMRPMRPANGAPPAHITQQTIESLFPANPSSASTSDAGAIDVVRPSAAELPPPDAWTIAAPKAPRRSRGASRQPRKAGADERGRKATVTFRMPGRDFVRLRFGARDLEMSCQALILEALECYLDANDVAEISDEICARETARLIRMRNKRHSE